MSTLELFPTLVFHRSLKTAKKTTERFNRELLRECYQIRDSDLEGQRWSEKNFLGGYTSYGSLSELFRLSSTFEQLKKILNPHVMDFARTLDMDLKNHKLEMTNCWINIVPKFVCHSSHLHPLSTLSGTYYVAVEKSELKFEDPRLSSFMASLPRTASAAVKNQRFISLKPKTGDVVLFESWLKHEVPQNLNRKDRVSISFNYNWF